MRDDDVDGIAFEVGECVARGMHRFGDVLAVAQAIANQLRELDVLVDDENDGQTVLRVRRCGLSPTVAWAV